METSKVSLKLLVDKKQNKVLFAEAGKDFVDFLLFLLTLPMGTVIRLLKKHGMVGSLGKLYDSIEKLSDTYMQTAQIKESVLKPIATISVSEVPCLLPADVSFVQTVRCHRCCRNPCCCFSGGSAPFPVLYESPRTEPPKEKGFVKDVITYMVMDNLVVSPMSTISSISLLNKFNVQELNALEERVVYVGMPEALKLLKESLQPKTVLTSVFLGNGTN